MQFFKVKERIDYRLVFEEYQDDASGSKDEVSEIRTVPAEKEKKVELSKLFDLSFFKFCPLYVRSTVVTNLISLNVFLHAIFSWKESFFNDKRTQNFIKSLFLTTLEF